MSWRILAGFCFCPNELNFCVAFDLIFGQFDQFSFKKKRILIPILSYLSINQNLASHLTYILTLIPKKEQVNMLFM